MADFEVVLPNMGFGMEEGKLISWLKKPGEAVRKGEAIAEVESDKANVELEAVVDGILDEILIPAEQVVPVGTVLARIRVGADSAISTSGSAPVSSTVSASGGASLNPPMSPSGESGREPKVSPVAQRL